jgi:uncharacterized membrane protein YccC
MLVLHPGPRRWLGGLRAAVCMGVPGLAGWLTGDLAAGLTATLGGFTVLYGGRRPYRNRAVLLAVIAVSLSAAVGLGIWAASIIWAGVLAVAAIATMATLLCNALEVGPPGAYQFALVCAVGIGLHAHHENPVRAALLVLAGGAFAWLVHMSGALIQVRGPERAAVAAAGSAVADYIDAVGTDRQDGARHHAAQAMHDAWETVITWQPARAAPSAAVRRLQELSRQLHMLFADAMTDASTHTQADPDAAGVARRLARQALDPFDPHEAAPLDRLPPAHPGVLAVLRQEMQPRSRSQLVVIRVAVATVLAGTLGGLLGLQHAYWAMSTAVLMLHQGLDRRRTTQRALERLTGTWLGLGLAAAVILTHPPALWLIAAIMALNFLIELTVVRNYALAVVFITAVALLIATGAQPHTDLGPLLLARGLDTATGCAVALAVFMLMVPPTLSTWLPAAIADTLDAVAATTAYLSPSAVTTPAARAARRGLQRRTLQLTQAFDNGINGSTGQRKAAEQTWPAIAATQRLAYRTLAECWRLERMPGQQGSDEQSPAESAAELRGPLRVMAEAVRAGHKPPPIVGTSGVLSTELLNLRDALTREPT